MMNILGARSWGRFWQVIALLLTLYIGVLNLETLGRHTYTMPYSGTIDARFERAPDKGPGWSRIKSMLPSSPLRDIGAVAGDHVRFDRPHEAASSHLTGEVVGFTLDQAGRQSRHEVKAIERRPNPERAAADLTVSLGVIACLLNGLMAAFMILRSRGRLDALMLGAALACYGLYFAAPPILLHDSLVASVVLGGLGSMVFHLVGPLFLGFAMVFVGEHVGARKAWEWRLLAAYTAANVTAAVIRTYSLFTGVTLPLLGDDLGGLLQFAGFAAACGYLFVGWRRSAYAVQQRHALMLLAIALIVLSQAMFVATGLWPPPESVELILTSIGNFITAPVAPGILLYAIFRQRVFDLGFAVNRTVVYGVVSICLLLTFGLLEWAAEHFLPIKSHETGVLVQAGLALGIFVVFHRLRHSVESAIEKLFFHRWRAKEDALRQFVEEARHIKSGATLEGAAVAALQAFSEGADCALYREDERGDYELRYGRVEHCPPVFDVDAPEAVRLRATLKPVDVADPSRGQIGVALPMAHRGEVFGMIVVGPKPNGFSYRPDELELLVWASHQIGLDLHALRLEQLEREAAGLRRDAQQLETRYQELERAFRVSAGGLVAPG